jgi:hypothetical protein
MATEATTGAANVASGGVKSGVGSGGAGDAGDAVQAGLGLAGDVVANGVAGPGSTGCTGVAVAPGKTGVAGGNVLVGAMVAVNAAMVFSTVGDVAVSVAANVG